jgi:hypothetical protein
VKSCCDRHADILPHGCRQGRDCPERLGGGTYWREIAEPVPSAETAIGWTPAAILLGVLLCVVLGSVAAWVFQNWPILRMALQ